MAKTNGVKAEALRTHLVLTSIMVACTVAMVKFPGAVAGLPLRCVMRSWLHVRCPFCGMTTDFISMLHGHWPTQNPASLAAAIIIYLVYPCMLLYTVCTSQTHLFHHVAVRSGVVALLFVLWILNNQPFR